MFGIGNYEDSYGNDLGADPSAVYTAIARPSSAAAVYSAIAAAPSRRHESEICSATKAEVERRMLAYAAQFRLDLEVIRARCGDQAARDLVAGLRHVF